MGEYLKNKSAGPSSSGTEVQKPKLKQRKIETRLGGLLAKIRNKCNNSSTSSSSSGKSKKIQFKWSRYNAIKDAYEIVKRRDGCGYRFVKIEDEHPILFRNAYVVLKIKNLLILY